MKINMREWAQSIIDSPKVCALPIMTHSGIEILGKSVNDAVTDGAVHAAAVMALADRFESIASSVIMDLTVEAEAFGSQIQFSEHEVPSVMDRLVCDRDSIEALEVPSLDKCRVPQYLLANELVVKSSSKPVISGCIGPYSLAGRLYDMSEIMMGVYIDPDLMKLLLAKCNEFIITYCRRLKEIGVNGVLIAEPAAGLLSNDICQEFSSVFVKEIVDELQDDDFMVILHNCGNTGQCTEAMAYTGAGGYHFGNAINMVDAITAIPNNALVVGNIDPVLVMQMSSAQQVYDQTMALLESMRDYPNFVLSTGCDTPPELPFENIESFYKAVADFNTQRL